MSPSCPRTGWCSTNAHMRAHESPHRTKATSNAKMNHFMLYHAWGALSDLGRIVVVSRELVPDVVCLEPTVTDLVLVEVSEDGRTLSIEGIAGTQCPEGRYSLSTDAHTMYR